MPSKSDTPSAPGQLQEAPAGLPTKTLVTYFPLEARKAFKVNEKKIAKKAYAKFFTQDLYLYRDVIPSIHTPISSKLVLPLSDARKLLEPGYLEAENGWCALSDGAAYVSSLTRFPGTTGDMVRWWFWWHSVEPERYALWFPYDHLDVRPSVAHSHLRRTDIPDVKKWLGSTHRVLEFVGAKPMTIRISFVDPANYDLPWPELREAGYKAAVCAELWHGFLPVKIGDFLHLWRRAPDGEGLELRSRYWLGAGVRLQLLGLRIPLDYIGGVLGFKRILAGEQIAYEHFMHDQIEFTNLASFLPQLYAEYLAGTLGD
ncbi:PhlG protein [Thozetella sp. PMI_491]|nr:PhlG protein [Thozetella sp. PMI_491]